MCLPFLLSLVHCHPAWQPILALRGQASAFQSERSSDSCHSTALAAAAREHRHPAPLRNGMPSHSQVFTCTPDVFRSTPHPYSTSTVNCCASVVDCLLPHGLWYRGSMDTPRRVLSLLRVSGNAQIDKTGLPRQTASIAQICTDENLKVAKGDEYRYEGLSGASVDKFPKFMTMDR